MPTSRTAENAATRFCNGVQLERVEGASGDLKWIHIATVGTYLGHWQGAFDLSERDLHEFVRNFKADERYSDGGAPVVPFDYEHASEQAPTSGDVPITGTPAPAWAMEMEVRSHADGAQLWTLAKLGDRIRAQIESGEYRFVSMAFTGKGVHQRSGAKIGCLITSIAFTNQPFLTGLEPIAAKARESGQAVVLTFDGPGHPTLVPDRALASNGANGLQPTPTAAKATAGTSATTTGDPNMSEQSVLGKQLAAKLTAAGLNNGRLLMADDEVGEAVADAITGSGDLASLLEGLGVTNAEQALASIAELKDAKAKMDALSTELAGALAQLDQAQSAEAEADVDQAMAAKAFDPSARSALLSQRKLLTKEHGHTDGSTKFLDHYGVKPGNTDPTKDHLLSSFAADKNGRQLSPLPDRESDTDGAQVIDLAAFTGRNQTEKLVSFCASKDVAFRSKTWGDQVRHASNLRRNSTIVNG